MKNTSIYALLVSVGNYERIGLTNLPTYKGDPVLFGTSLMLGLSVPQDHIRILIGDEKPGYVRAAAMARAIAEMRAQLCSEDTFILYFSGHGRLAEKVQMTPEVVCSKSGPEQREKEQMTPEVVCSPGGSIIFSDGEIELQSVIDYMDRIPAGTKIVILDCCYSGGFKGAGPKKLEYGKSISEFAGKGIAVIASSCADEISRPGPGGEYSVFTIMLAHSIVAGHKPLQEKVSLNEIYDTMMQMMAKWNDEHPDRQQHPVFRSSLGGTVFFQLRRVQMTPEVVCSKSDLEQREKVQMTSGVQNRSGVQSWVPGVQSIKILDNSTEKRLAVFIVVDEKAASPQSLSRITKKIANHMTAQQDVIWCYFGYDRSDIRRGLHVAYTIWCRTDVLRAKYYRVNKNATIEDGIYLFQNTSYAILKDMQRPAKSRESVIADHKRLLSLIVTQAERFAYDLQEVRNRMITIKQMREEYGDWAGSVKSLYLRLSDEEAAPDDLYEWAEAILDLAGWVADIAILFEGSRSTPKALSDNEQWLIDHSIRRYYEAVEKLRFIDETVF